jgi:hypothetical protein
MPTCKLGFSTELGRGSAKPQEGDWVILPPTLHYPMSQFIGDKTSNNTLCLALLLFLSRLTDVPTFQPSN